MDSLGIIELVIESYHDAIRLNISGVNEQKRNKARSSKFIELVTRNLQSIYRTEENFEVFSRERNEKSIFGLKEYLFDINVCKIEYEKTPANKVNVPYVTKSIIQLESEFAQDVSESLIDFSKLVCGKSELKIMILPLSDNCLNYLEPLRKPAKNIEEELYAIFLLHPSSWDISKLETYKIFKFNKDIYDFCKASQEIKKLYSIVKE